MTSASRLLVFIIFGIFCYAIYVPAGTSTDSQRSASFATMASAPVKCGPYFLYIHPNYWLVSPRKRRQLRYKTYVVTRIPPDANVSEIRQLWAYGYMQHTLSFSTVLERAKTHPRTAVRPALWDEMMIGDYIGDHYCKPYKPYKLECSYNHHICKDHSAKPAIPAARKTPTTKFARREA